MQWKRSVALAALITGMVAGVALDAQAGPVSIAPKPGASAPVRVKVGSPQERPPAAANPLGLTKAQQDKLTAINKKANADFQAIVKGKGSQKDKQKQALALNDRVRQQQMAVLTPSQRTKVNDAMAKQKAAFAKQQAMMRKRDVKIKAMQKTLTPQQKSQMDQVNKEMSAKFLTIQKDTKLNNQQKMQKFLALQMEARTRVNNILTAKQKAMLK